MSDGPIIERNIAIDEESFALVVTTHHDGAVATTAIHRHDFQRRIGGVRFVESTGEPFAFARALADGVAAIRTIEDGRFDHDFVWAPWVMYGLG